MSDMQEGAKFFVQTGQRPGQISSISFGQSGAKSLKNAQKVDIRLTPEGMEELRKAIENFGNPSIKLTIHVGEKEAEGGRTFTSGFMFVNTCEPKGTVAKKKKVVTKSNAAEEELKKLG